MVQSMLWQRQFSLGLQLRARHTPAKLRGAGQLVGRWVRPYKFVKHHLASSFPRHFGSSEPKWSKEQIRYRESSSEAFSETLSEKHFSHPLPSTLRRTSYLDAELPPVGDGESVGCWKVTIHSSCGNACEIRSYQSNMAESLDAPERGSKKVRVCFLSVLLECALRWMHLLFHMYNLNMPLFLYISIFKNLYGWV